MQRRDQTLRLVDRWQVVLGHHLQSITLFHACGGLQPQKSTPTRTLFVTVSDDAALSSLRSAWPREDTQWATTPYVMRTSRMAMFQALFPMTAWRVAQGETLLGAPPFRPIAPPTNQQRLRDAALSALWASERLWPDRLLPSVQEERAAVVAQLRAESGLPPTRDALLGLASLLTHLDEAATADAPSPMMHSDAPRALPTLQAIYSELDTAILVLPAGGGASLTATDWDGVAAELKSRYRRLYVTTAPQLRHIAQQALALSFNIGRFRHDWGSDVLASVDYALPAALSEIARHVLYVDVALLPQRYFAWQSDAPSPFLHEIQNELLKVQLKHDLFGMFYGQRGHAAPLFGRNGNQAVDVRVERLGVCLSQWVDLHQNLLARA